jgi:hypothetical protein
MDHLLMRYRLTMPGAQKTFSRLARLLVNFARRYGGSPASVDRPTAIRTAFREYLDVQRQFMKTADACSRKGWPDRGAVLYHTWKCQELYIHRQELRFDHLLSQREFEEGVWHSLSSVTDRLDKGWSVNDERGALGGNPAYKVVTTEIPEMEHLRASMDRDLIDEPLRGLQRHAEYRAARQAIYEKVLELDKRLGKLFA